MSKESTVKTEAGSKMERRHFPRREHSSAPSVEGTIREAVQVLIDVCREFGLIKGPKTQTSIDKTVSSWLYAVVTHPNWDIVSQRHEIVLKLIKFQLCSFFAWGVDQPQPQCDFKGLQPGYLISGSVGRWLHGLKARSVARDAQGIPGSDFYHWLGLLHSLKLSKRAMPRPDSFCAYHQLCKTYEKLTTFVDHSDAFPAPSDIPLPKDDFWNRELYQFGSNLVMVETHQGLLKDGKPMEFVSESRVQDFYVNLFRSYVRHVMSDLNLSHLEDLTCPIYSVSRSATYTNSRSALGMYGDILWHRKGGDVADVFPIRSLKEEWVWDGERSFKMDIDLSYEHAKYIFARDHCFEETQRDYELGVDRNGFEGLMYTSIFSPVIEALKVRSISKGSGACCLFLKPYQHAVHSYLKKFDQFANVGCPASPASLNVVGMLEGDEQFASVDYESSTDNLDQIWSQAASEEIFTTCNVPSQAQILWKESLYNGGVRLGNGPSLKKRFPDLPIEKCSKTRQMARGQLMGNIMSFPILCLANGFCLWLSRCVSTQQWLDPLGSCYAVNGDDGVVRLNRRGFDFWGKLASAMGFPPSVGKVYWSKDFFDFDSECFCPSGRCETPPIDLADERPTFFTRVPFCHYGLVRCAARTGNCVQLTELLGCEKGMSVGGIQRYIVSRCPRACLPLILEDLYRFFLLTPRVYQTIQGRPWYMPKSLGGIDMVPIDRDGNVLTRGSFSTEPIAFMEIEHVHASGVKKVYRIGPSDDDAAKAHFLMVAMRAGGLKLPPCPKREHVEVHVPEQQDNRYSFDEVDHSDESGSLSTFSAWSEWLEYEPDADRPDVTEAFVKRCLAWNRSLKRVWHDLSRDWTPFWCLSGLTLANPPVSCGHWFLDDAVAWTRDPLLAEIRQRSRLHHGLQVVDYEMSDMILSESYHLLKV
jgi:hypothetical protein